MVMTLHERITLWTNGHPHFIICVYVVLFILAVIVIAFIHYLSLPARPSRYDQANKELFEKWERERNAKTATPQN